MTHRWIAPLLLAAAAACPARALAQASSDDAALAETLFQDARALAEKKDWERACPKFAESQRLDPRLGTLLNLATCHEQQGKTASAWAEFGDAAVRAERADQKDRAELARDRARALERRLSRVTIAVATPVDGLEVVLDGRALGAAAVGSALPLDPGEHALEVRAPGRVAWQSRIQVAPGPASTMVEVPALAFAPAAAPGPTGPTGSLSSAPPVPSAGQAAGTNHDTMRTAGWILGGVGVVGIGVGAVFGLRAASQEGDADDTCPGRVCPDAASVDKHDDAHTSATVSTIAFAAGVAGLGAGVVLLLLSSGDETKSVGLANAPGGAALRARVRW